MANDVMMMMVLAVLSKTMDRDDVRLKRVNLADGIPLYRMGYVDLY